MEYRFALMSVHKQGLNLVVSKYIASRGNERKELTFFSRWFRNDALTKAKIDLAIQFKEQIIEENHLPNLEVLEHKCKKETGKQNSFTIKHMGG